MLLVWLVLVGFFLRYFIYPIFLGYIATKDPYLILFLEWRRYILAILNKLWVISRSAADDTESMTFNTAKTNTVLEIHFSGPYCPFQTGFWGNPAFPQELNREVEGVEFQELSFPCLQNSRFLSIPGIGILAQS